MNCADSPVLPKVFERDSLEHGAARTLAGSSDEINLKAALVRRFDTCSLDDDLQKRIFALVYDSEVRSKLQCLEHGLSGAAPAPDALVTAKRYFERNRNAPNSRERIAALQIITNSPSLAPLQKAMLLREILGGSGDFHPAVTLYITRLLQCLPRDERASALGGLIGPAAARATHDTYEAMQPLIEGEQNAILIKAKAAEALQDRFIPPAAREQLVNFTSRLRTAVSSPTNSARLQKYYPG